MTALHTLETLQLRLSPEGMQQAEVLRKTAELIITIKVISRFVLLQDSNLKIIIAC